MECYLLHCLKDKRTIVTQATMWRSSKDTMLSEISQARKDSYQKPDCSKVAKSTETDSRRGCHDLDGGCCTELSSKPTAAISRSFSWACSPRSSQLGLLDADTPSWKEGAGRVMVASPEYLAIPPNSSIIAHGLGVPEKD